MDMAQSNWQSSTLWERKGLPHHIFKVITIPVVARDVHTSAFISVVPKNRGKKEKPLHKEKHRVNRFRPKTFSSYV